MLFSNLTAPTAKRFGDEVAVEMIADAGFPAIDYSFHSYDDQDAFFADGWLNRAKELRKRADARGVVFNQAHAFFSGGYEFTLEKTRPNLPRVFEFAAVLGCRNVVVHPLKKGRYYGNEQENFEVNMEYYSSLASHARKAGVMISIENMWQRHPISNLIGDCVCASPEEMIRYYDTLNDPEVFDICLDLGHVALCAREPEDVIRALGHDRLHALHVHDVDYRDDLHTVMGMGRINWEAVCQALADIDYDGVFTLEVGIHSSVHDALVPTHLRFLADLCRFYTDRIDALRKKN